MSAPTDFDDLARRLVDLAESAGPWDDPLPEVRRRAADLASDPHSGSAESPIFRAPTATRAARRPRGWLRSIDLTLAASVAAIVGLVVGVGWLFHAGGPSSEKSSAGTEMASMAAGASTTAGGVTADNRPVPRSAASATACGWPASTSAVTLQAPARVRSGATVSLSVRLTGPAAADVYSPIVVVLSQGRVVGHLWVQVIPPGPRVRPSSPTAARATLTGTLRRGTCAQATAPWQGSPSPRGLALPPGSYQLIAVSAAAGQPVASAPVSVTVIP